MASLQKNKQQQEDYKAKIEADIKAQDEYIAKIEAEIKAKENSGSANVVNMMVESSSGLQSQQG